MAGASMVKAAYEQGRATEQKSMAAKHVHSLIGRPGWDGSSDFSNANSAINDVDHHLGLAHDRHAEMAEAVHDNDTNAIKDAHAAVLEHLNRANIAAKTAGSVIDAALRERGADNGPEKEPGAKNAQKLLKGHLDRDGDHVRFFVPFSKVSELKTADGDTLMVEGCASVADYLDDQNDVPDADALEKAFAEWAPFGNIRLQHKVDRPVGTIRQPVVGDLPDGMAKPGWWIGVHPVTNTKAAFIRAHIIDPETVKLIKAGVMTGFSIGGSVNKSRNVWAEVDDNGVVTKIYGEAA